MLIKRIDTGRVMVLEGHAETVSCIKISGDGKFIASGEIASKPNCKVGTFVTTDVVRKELNYFTNHVCVCVCLYLFCRTI